MKFKVFIFIFSIFIFSGSAAALDRCAGFGGMSEAVCSTSYIQLLAKKEKYEGKLIDFRGVVHWNSKSEVYIFPSNEYREVGVIEDMIRLDESAIEKLKERDIKSGDWIRVVGRFKAKDEVEFQIYFGVLSEVFLVAPIGLHRHLFKPEREKEKEQMGSKEVD